jgi:hypothetical protein
MPPRRVMKRRSYPLVRAPLHPADEPGPRLARRTEQLAERAWGVRRLTAGGVEWTDWQNAGSTVTYSLATAMQGFSGAITTATTAFGNLANVTWGTTMGTGNNTIFYDPPPLQVPYYDPPRVRTPEEEAARAARILRQNEERTARIAAQEAARTRARNTLMEFLTPEQRAEYEAEGHFVCTGSEGNRYRIERGNAGNVVYLDERGEAAGRLCAHPSMSEQWLPDQDVALAQMLALMTDEQNFVRIANVHRGRAPEFAGAVLLGR